MKKKADKKLSTARGLRLSSSRKLQPPKRDVSPVIELVPALLKIQSILVPTDFSPESKKALAYAVAFARQFGAKLTLLNVVEPLATPDFVQAFPLVAAGEKIMAECKRRLERVINDMRIEPNLIERTLVRPGRPYFEIVEAARTLKTDLIIISTHGYTGLKHVLLGSSTERVVRHAPCPVLVVRRHEQEFA